jgi:Flp pilus assembly protein TadD
MAPPASAAVFRSLSLCAILYQFALAAGGLADVPVFVGGLALAVGLAALLARRGWTPTLNPKKPGQLNQTWKGALILALLPPLVMLAVMLPGAMAGGEAVFWDGLRLGLERNLFVLAFPWYYGGLGSYFAFRSRRFLRAEALAQGLLAIVIFCFVKSSSLPVYRLPVLMIALWGGVFFLQALALIFSAEPRYRQTAAEKGRAILAVLVLCIAGALLLIRPSQEEAVSQGGGLLQPKLFRFDFSQLVRLESEIRLNDELVMIVGKEEGDSHTLYRRFALSGYDPKQGFYFNGEIDEAAHPRTLPPGRRLIPHEETKLSRQSRQEYFIVNFDSSAFIALNQPVEVTPFVTWDASSFNSAYEVTSLVSAAPRSRIIAAMRGEWDAGKLGLSEEEFRYYTDYGGSRAIAEFAGEITEGRTQYWDKIYRVYETLKYGDYRYSLKPGIAPDGNQLEYFLFNVKKGYCSYFAFSFALLLRSLGIPARVAVGFYVDPGQNSFGYYPVRADMAHAWVEVRFPEYGWIEFDPTTEQLAAGEDFMFSPGVDRDLFERLMREILENRSKLEERMGEDEEESQAGRLGSLVKEVGRLFFAYRWMLLACAYIALTLGLRLRHLAGSALVRRPRTRARHLWGRAVNRLRLAGLRQPAGESAGEWAQGLVKFNLYPLYQRWAASRFARDFSIEDYDKMKGEYRAFSAAYRAALSPFRRALAWLAAPLALALPPGRGAGGLLIIILLFLPLTGDRAQEAPADADQLYAQALAAQTAENYNRALQLLTEGAGRFPQDVRFPWALGGLYQSQRLYAAAHEAYRKAEALMPGEPEILFSLSETAGFLNRDDEAAACLELLLESDPDDSRAISDLAWMYYKLHRLDEGEALLLDARSRLGEDMIFDMTLGTIYADMFRYDDSKGRYQAAIQRGKAEGERNFTAVAYYNLSILESRFYHYEAAHEMTEASLDQSDRSSGRLARGELLLRRLDTRGAIAEYMEAYERDRDHSALPKVSLAQAYQIAGRLEEARRYGEDCLASRDHSWMVNYGINPTEYLQDVHEILSDAYSGLAKVEALTPRYGPGDVFTGLCNRVKFAFKAKVNALMHRKYSLIAARSYDREGQRLDALGRYFAAFEGYPRRAAAYLRSARAIEVPLIPQAAGDYLVKEAELLARPALAEEALARFDPLWERDLTADAWAVIARRARGEAALEAAEKLYALNPGALRQQGIRLPVQVEAGAVPGGRALVRALRRAGFTPGGNERRFVLRLGFQAGELRYELFDRGRGVSVAAGTVEGYDGTAQEAAAAAREVGDGVMGGVRRPGD